MGGLGLNAEQAPDVGKRIGERCGPGRCDDETDPDDGKWRSGLDEHRHNACVYPGHLWGESPQRECPRPQETEAYHQGDDNIQADGQRDPRHREVDRIAAVQHRSVRQSGLYYREDREH